MENASLACSQKHVSAFLASAQFTIWATGMELLLRDGKLYFSVTRGTGYTMSLVILFMGNYISAAMKTHKLQKYILVDLV